MSTPPVMLVQPCATSQVIFSQPKTCPGVVVFCLNILAENKSLFASWDSSCLMILIYKICPTLRYRGMSRESFNVDQHRTGYFCIAVSYNILIQDINQTRHQPAPSKNNRTTYLFFSSSFIYKAVQWPIPLPPLYMKYE